MFSKGSAFTKLDLALRNVRWFRGHNSRMMSRWIPRRPVLGVELDGTSLSLACL